MALGILEGFWEMHNRKLCILVLLVCGMLASVMASAKSTQWTPEEAVAWYEKQGWLVGANFVPSTAINQLEMWQAESFDPETIDRELGWASSIGFNCMRVFLHDMVWAQDPEAYCKRIDAYLAISAKHNIKTMLVLFDSVWDPFPALGPQRKPRPGVHNSGWVQGPHIDVLKDEARHGDLKPYVQGVMKRFGQDERVSIWDLYNEPGNTNGSSYGKHEPKDKAQLCRRFLEKVLVWARETDPEQPLTVGAWQGVTRKSDTLDPLDQYMLDESDVITFHTYDRLGGTRRAVERLQKMGRPVICTEYMSRGSGSTFQTILPHFKEENVGAISWGLVNGKSQTIYPWASWKTPFDAEPDVWFHDVFRPDGTPFDAAETDLIRSLTKSGE
jgi:cellulase (glycosyl hydrolase family 5)